jgi:hypothetical protein
VEKTTLYLAAGTLARLRARAAREGRPQAEILRESVERYLTDSDPLGGFAGAFEGPDDGLSGQALDDWMHEHWIEDLEHKIAGSDPEPT